MGITSSRAHAHLRAVRALPLALLLVSAVALAGLPPISASLAHGARASRHATAVLPRSFLGATTIANGLIYVMGGSQGQFAGPYLDLNQAYNPKDNTWLTLAPLPTPRFRLGVATGRDGRIYAIGGITGSNMTTGIRDVVEAYDPYTNAWSTRAALPVPTAGLGVVAGPDGRIYALGGISATTHYLNTIYAYDPATDTWQTMASMLLARQDAAVAVSGGRIYVIGGLAGDAQTAEVEAYTPATNTWQVVAPLGGPRSEASAATGADGRIYVFGGVSNASFTINSAVEVYDPASDAWSAVTNMPTPRWALAAATALDGRIIVLGGVVPVFTASQETSVVEAFNPSTNAWATLAPLPASNPTPFVTPIGGRLATPTLVPPATATLAPSPTAAATATLVPAAPPSANQGGGFPWMVLAGLLIALVAAAIGTALGLWLRRPRVPAAPAPSGPELPPVAMPTSPSTPMPPTEPDALPPGE